jgi:hypothetical protein
MPTTITYSAEAFSYPDDPADIQGRRYRVIETTDTDGVITKLAKGMARVAANPTEEGLPNCYTVTDPMDQSETPPQLKLLTIAPCTPLS